MTISEYIFQTILAVILFCAITIIGKFILNYIALKKTSLIICKKSDTSFFKKYIFKLYRCGLLADFIGLICLAIYSSLTLVDSYREPKVLSFLSLFLVQMIITILYPIFGDIYSVIYICIGIFISAVCIFVFDYFKIFKKATLSKKQKVLLTITFSIFTAPYYFLIPLHWVL